MLKGAGAAPAHLPKASDAGAGFVVGGDMVAVFAQLAGKQWARANNAHLSAQHIDELGKLVDAGAADDAADGGHARVVGEFEIVGLILLVKRFIFGFPAFKRAIGIEHHASEFDEGEELAVFTHALLCEENGPSVVAFDAPCHPGKQRREKEQKRRGAQDVEHPLQQLRASASEAVAGAQEQHFVAEEVGNLHAEQRQTVDGGNDDEVVPGEHELLGELSQPMVVVVAEHGHDLVGAGLRKHLAHGKRERDGGEGLFAQLGVAFARVGADHGHGCVAKEALAGQRVGRVLQVFGAANQHIGLGQLARPEKAVADGEAGQWQGGENEQPGDTGPEAGKLPFAKVHDHGVDHGGHHDHNHQLLHFVPPGFAARGGVMPLHGTHPADHADHDQAKNDQPQRAGARPPCVQRGGHVHFVQQPKRHASEEEAETENAQIGGDEQGFDARLLAAPARPWGKGAGELLIGAQGHHGVARGERITVLWKLGRVGRSCVECRWAHDWPARWSGGGGPEKAFDFTGPHFFAC